MNEPILIIYGPSGAGKSHFGPLVANELNYLYIELDRWREGDGIDLAGFRNEWDAFKNQNDPKYLAEELRKRIQVEGKEGAVLTLPSKYSFPLELIEKAESYGFRFVIIFGPKEDCCRAFIEREKALGHDVTESDWGVNNEYYYEINCGPEYKIYQVNAFEGSTRRKQENIIEDIKRVHL